MKEQEILDSCLEALSAGASLFSCLEKHPELSAESLRILQAAAQLHRASAQLTPDPAFKRRSRAKLMQRMTASSQPAAAAAPAVATGLKQRWHDFWAQWRLPSLGGMQFQPLAAVLAVAVILALGGGVVAAAQKSVPGTPLYSIKRLSEQARTTLAHNDIQWQLNMAQRRLDEAVAVVDEDQAKVDELLSDYARIMGEVADNLSQQESSGLESGQKDEIYAMVTEQIAQLQQLEGKSTQYEAALHSAQAIATLLHPAPSPEAPLLTPWPTPSSIPAATPTVMPSPTGPVDKEIVPATPVMPTPPSPQTPSSQELPKPPVSPTIAPLPTSSAPPTAIPPTPTMPAPASKISPSPTMPKTPSFSP